MLKELCNSIGVSGYEMKIIELLKDSIFRTSIDDVYQDAIGNLIYYKKGLSNKKRILISAHCDEVGLQITKIYDDKLKFKVLGNIKCYNLYQQRVFSKTVVEGLF